jgi:hypothetical protein
MFPTMLSGQVVSGVVTERISGLRVANVIVALLDSAGSQVSHSLTNERGEYRLAGRLAGSYRLRTLRVGFLPTTSQPFPLDVGTSIERNVVLAGIPVTLDTVAVADRSVCRRYEDGAGFTATVWEQARTAILAAKLGQDARSVEATILSYRRHLDPDGSRIRSASGELLAGRSSRIYASLPAEELSRRGYVTSDRTGTVFHAPDLDVLLSDVFVRDHCFRVAESDAGQDLLSITFEPTQTRHRVTGIRGTVWVERATAALRRLEFSYANAGPIVDRSAAGGAIEFVRFEGGEWAIANWNIRMPVAELRRSRGQVSHFEISELRETGGYLVSAARNGDTLWAAFKLPMHGLVLDSEAHPVPGALVALRGRAERAVTDSAGRFAIPDLPPDAYIVEVRTPQLLRSERSVEFTVVLMESTPAVTIRLPVAAASQLSAIGGIVVTDSTNRPVIAAEVSLVELQRRTITDGRGQFELHDIPPGKHRVVVRRLGFAPLDTILEFPARRFQYRRIHLEAVQTLATVEVTAERSIASFEEHRRSGMGTFFTRAQLARLERLHMRAVLSQVPGANVVSGSGAQSWIMSGRAQRSLGNTQAPPSPEELRAGARVGCYAHVYVDGILVSRGPPDPLFDINSVNVDQVEAVEFYAGPAQTPARYLRSDAQCGVLVIWLLRNP